jgi:uncharacterized membrane protein
LKGLKDADEYFAMDQLVTIGVVVILVGFALIVIGSIAGAGKGEAKFAVGGFIGPIPFGFANDKWALYGIIAMSAIILAFYILMSRKLL